MKLAIALSLLTVFTLACSPQTPSGSPTRNGSAVTEPGSASPTPVPMQNIYTNAQFGFYFEYPNGYTLDTRNEMQPSTEPDTLQSSVYLWTTEDYELIRSGALEGQGTEYPPNISISVHDNSDSRSLSDWIDPTGALVADKSVVTTASVAGQEAIAYPSSGLYELDNFLLLTPDGRHLIHLRVEYFDREAPSREAFEQVVASFRFD